MVILSFLKNASVLRGIIFILTACGIQFTDYESEQVVTTGLSLLGTIELFLNRNKTDATKK